MSDANPLRKTQTLAASSGTRRIMRDRVSQLRGEEVSLRRYRDLSRADTTSSTVHKRNAEDMQRSPIDVARPAPKGEAKESGSKIFHRMKPAGKLTQISTYRKIQIAATRTTRADVGSGPFPRYTIAQQMTAPASSTRLSTWRTKS